LVATPLVAVATTAVRTTAVRTTAVTTGAPETRDDPAGKPLRAVAADAVTTTALAAPAPVIVARAVAPASPAAAPPSATPTPTPQQQVSTALMSSLRTGADGTHQLVVRLHPNDLGPVNVLARIEHGAVTVALTSTNDAARDALHQGLPQLRDDLRQAGFTGVAVSVDTADAGAGGQSAPSGNPAARSTPSGGSDARTSAPSNELAPTPSRTVGRVDSLDRWL
jgi:flagellar hook-length control protein FliK